MSIKPDHWIKRMVKEHNMIEPFEENLIRNGKVSYGLSSYGYDLRCAPEFKIFTNVHSAVVDPKKFDDKSFVDFKEVDSVLIPPNSFALTRSVEYFKIPRNVLGLCIGKCLVGDTQVIDPHTGCLLRLDEFINKGKKSIVNWNSIHSQQDDVTNYSYNGLRPVYKIKTRTGREIQATSNHPFKTFTGWIPMEEMQKGTRIAVPRKLPFFGNGKLTNPEAILLGLMISDGQCRTPGSSPRYTSGDPVLHEVLNEKAATLGLFTKPVGNMSRNITNSPSRGGIMEKNKMYRWLESLGLSVTSRGKFVPECVFEAPKRVIADFLRALFSGDGTVYRSGDLTCVEFYTISEQLARQVHHLLLRFGIVSFFALKTISSNDYKSFRITITSKSDILLFAKEIGFISGSRKWFALEEVIDYISHYPQLKSNHDTLPTEVWSILEQTSREQGKSMRSFGFKPHRNQSVPRELVSYLAQDLSDSNLGGIVDNDIYWDTVKSIEYIGIKPVYDLTMQQDPNFVANDFIVHNSTYARCGIIVNVTPLQPEWDGYLIIEISNTTPLPAKIYANEGIAEILFFEADEVAEKSYKELSGKYSHQKSIVLPKV